MKEFGKSAMRKKLRVFINNTNVMKSIHYNLIFRPEPEGGFTVTVPALPGCITYGRDLHEAQSMAYDAIRAYLGSLKKHNQSVPSDDGIFIGSIQVPLSAPAL